jgi:hypothetical protein
MPHPEVLNAAITSRGPAFYPSTVHVVLVVDVGQKWKYIFLCKTSFQQ